MRGDFTKNSENLRKTATLAPFVPFSLSLLIPLEQLSEGLQSEMLGVNLHDATPPRPFLICPCNSS